MSALSLATLGVQCTDRALSMATLGVFCPDAVDEFQGTYGGRYREYYELALREDEEMIILIRTFLGIIDRWH